MRGRLMESRIIGQDFLLQMIAVWQKKIGSRMDLYMSTGNEKYLEEMDGKDIDRYLKILESLQKFSAEPKNAASLIGLNLGEGGVTVERKGNSVEITPKTKAIGVLLKEFADQRREEEKK